MGFEPATSSHRRDPLRSRQIEWLGGFGDFFFALEFIFIVPLLFQGFSPLWTSSGNSFETWGSAHPCGALRQSMQNRCPPSTSILSPKKRVSLGSAQGGEKKRRRIKEDEERRGYRKRRSKEEEEEDKRR